jgi:hypothetical protein
MDVDWAIEEVAIALQCYAEDSISSDDFEEDRIVLDKAWNVILNILNRDIPREMCEDLLKIKPKSFPTGNVDFGTSME